MPGMEDYGQPDDSGWGHFSRSYQRDVNKVEQRLERGQMTIFFVTVVHSSGKRSRCWGYYPDFATAEKAVLENWTDIYEMGYYDLAVIEEFPVGVMATPSSSKWYRFNHRANQPMKPYVEAIEPPAPFASCGMWSIG